MLHHFQECVTDLVFVEINNPSNIIKLKTGFISKSFTSQCRKMVRHTLKILQHLLQDFQSVFDHFTTLRSKRLNSKD